MTISQNLNPERAVVVACELEAEDSSGAQLVAVVELGEETFRYRIETSRSWRALTGGEVSIDKQRLIDFALWSYLREFTGEIDMRLARPQLRTSTA